MQSQDALLSKDELYLFNVGQLFQAYRTLGAHPIELDGQKGVRFAVWAPHAQSVGVTGDFNGWSEVGHSLVRFGTTGVWTGFIAEADVGSRYKYAIVDSSGANRLKADPFALQSELRPNTASIVNRIDGYEWHDRDWMERKKRNPPYDGPMLIYEVHLASWRMDAPEHFRTYEQLSIELVEYAQTMGYTHIELLPIMEHPLDRSWGYQTTGYYSATSRYGPPDGLKVLIDKCHQGGIGVLLDWVPGHFCKDDHGLRLFDGTALYEDEDYRRAEKPLWGTLAFDFGKPEVQSFLISDAVFWLDIYHFDGLRVDAIASMIDLHFDKPDELKTNNKYGTSEHLEALDFLRKLNETVFRHFPEALMIAEDSSSYPAVTSPTYLGGLGFNYKWNMGWMNDMLRYMETHPDQRSSHHSLITFSLMYAFSENYVLPLSHDEVVHGKRSMLHKMPGSYEEKFANLRLFYGYWMTHPGKKLLFMGGEFGQYDEWKDFAGLDWELLQYPLHDSMHRYVRHLNRVYLDTPSLWELDHNPEGFQWIDVNNAAQCILSFLRIGKKEQSFALSVCNFSNQSYPRYRIGVPSPGRYRHLLNSDEADYGGSGISIPKEVSAESVPMHGQPCSIDVPVPALSFGLWEKIG
ncbi:1,4-alpha-glucan branching protein GlgB [Cohnella faecalis]|uniref:1,4-alpha-glucan branching enzyme GlgB n=1 Tax=Cohnella faecalis TaxID=2315694 RepID=A0A398CDR8_9BACL|nr:1,4-alpha-glucan branching protein GlgB [Cohnella faecalis]RIE00780.1 1,4-alpha-glucan branching protein GlgB [Cohnella faecalis]